MCDHSDDKKETHLSVFDPVGEAYMCECGVLIDITTNENHLNPVHPMSPAELTDAINELLDREAVHGSSS